MMLSAPFFVLSAPVGLTLTMRLAGFDFLMTTGNDYSLPDLVGLQLQKTDN